MYTGTSKRGSSRLPYEFFRTSETDVLNEAFDVCPYLTPVMKNSLLKILNESLERIQYWFQRKRGTISREIETRKCKTSICMV